jgi:hypothetical protein
MLGKCLKRGKFVGGSSGDGKVVQLCVCILQKGMRMGTQKKVVVRRNECTARRRPKRRCGGERNVVEEEKEEQEDKKTGRSVE